MSRCALTVFLAFLSFAGCKRSDPGVKREATPVASPTADRAREMDVYVRAPDAIRYALPARTSKQIERLPIGTRLRIAPGAIEAGGESFFAIVPAGENGYVRDVEVDAEKATAPAARVAMNAAMGRGDLASAREEAERLLALEATALDAFSVLTAVHEAWGDDAGLAALRARGEKLRLPAPTPTPDAVPEAAPKLAAGDTVFVAATTLLLQRGPKVKGPPVAELPINTPVDVLEVSGEWLRVRANPMIDEFLVVDLSQKDGAPPEPRGAPVRSGDVIGFARPRFLSTTALSFETLLADAKRFEEAGNLPDAVRRLERAAAVRSDAEILHRLTAMAARAGLYGIAARTAARVSPPSNPPANAGSGEDETGSEEEGAAVVASVDLIAFGCTSAPIAPAVVEFSETILTSEFPSDVCVQSLPPYPCGPCEHHFTDFEGTDAERGAAEAQAGEADDVDWRRELAEREDQIGKLRKVFPSGPWARVVIPRQNLGLRQKLFVYALPFRGESSCGDLYVLGVNEQLRLSDRKSVV